MLLEKSFLAAVPYFLLNDLSMLSCKTIKQSVSRNLIKFGATVEHLTFHKDY